jgi:alpha-D-xyloside xylohydrolase
MALLKNENNRFIRYDDHETVMIEAWGKNSLRVRVTRRREFSGNNWALLSVGEISSHQDAEISISEQTANIKNGTIEARINKEGWISFYNDKGYLLLEEYWRNRWNFARYTVPLNIGARELKPIPSNDSYRLVARFEARDGEKIYGLGQYQEPYLDKKGNKLELAHRNSQSSVPFALSNFGYGFLWNNPAIGWVNFAKNVTEWSAESTLEMDYWITSGDTPAMIEQQYASVTGKVPMMPEHGLGFTQCRMRYRNQEELLNVVRNHKKLGLPLDMVVADFFHWTVQGDYKFDPVDWPDVRAMLEELKSYSVELMVSIWPTVDSRSGNFAEMKEKGYLMEVDRGLRINMNWMGETVFFDPTNPGAREFIWSKAKKNYYDIGIKTFWLDEAEPEFGVYDFDIYRLYAGPVMQVGNIYPFMFAKTFYDGMKNEGVEHPMNLIRTAWAGSQRFGALVWSGDIHSGFRSLREQLAAGLSMGIAGIPWWTTDIGGFSGGYTDDPAFHELLVRWFEWGCFCPVFRLHGDRMPYREPVEKFRDGIQQFGSGSDNEIWSFGEDVQEILVEYLHLRERLKPYIRKLMLEAHEKGTPVMRPLFYDFPEDKNAWETGTEYMFGPDLLVAPVLEEKVIKRKLYLPSGSKWTCVWTGTEYDGGNTVEVDAPLERIPLFFRDGERLPIL